MNRRIPVAAMALLLSVSASQAFAQAFVSATATGPNTTTATTAMPLAKGKQISFHLRNDSAAAIVIQAGDQQITIAAGKSVSLKLATGTQVTTTTGTAHVAAGGVLTTVDSNLSGNTLVVS